MSSSSSSLKTYRVVCFDVELNVVLAELIQAATDEEAIAKVEAAGYGSKCEIWDGNRLVTQLESERRTG